MNKTGKTMVKCPLCGHRGALDQFNEKTAVHRWGGIHTQEVRPRCPSCGARLRHKNWKLAVVSMFVVFGALLAVIVFLPAYVSHFGYIVGFAFFFVYLFRKFRPANRDDIFESERASSGSDDKK